MEQEKEYVEHTVQLDDYIELTMKIPKVMTAMELRGLMRKSEKLLKLSEAKIDASENKGSSPMKVKYPAEKKSNKQNNSKSWTKEKEDMLRQKYGKMDTRDLAKEMGVSMSKIHQKVYYMKQRGRW